MISMRKYTPYSQIDLSVLINETWTVRSYPYKLHAAFALSCLYDIIVTCQDEDENECGPESIWSTKIPVSVLKHLVADIAADFNDAVENSKPIRIWGKPYSIRKTITYDPSRLIDIFDFERAGDDYIIAPEGVLNLNDIATKDEDKNGEKEQLKSNRVYFHQVFKLASDDSIDGWSKLTDMEVAMYCWVLFNSKHQDQGKNKLSIFIQKYSMYIQNVQSELLGCLVNSEADLNTPLSLYAFAQNKVKEWNAKHKQKSYAESIPPDEADDYWYNSVLKTL